MNPKIHSLEVFYLLKEVVAKFSKVSATTGLERVHHVCMETCLACLFIERYAGSAIIKLKLIGCMCILIQMWNQARLQAL